MKHECILDGSQQPASPISGPDDYRYKEARLEAYCLDTGARGAGAWEKWDVEGGPSFYERAIKNLNQRCGHEHELTRSSWPGRSSARTRRARTTGLTDSRPPESQSVTAICNTDRK